MFPSCTSLSTTTIADSLTVVSVDGKDAIYANGDVISQSSSSSATSTPMIQTSYQTRSKWAFLPDYLDTLLSISEKSCDHITIYQVPCTFDDDTISEKATSIDVAEALNFASANSVKSSIDGENTFCKGIINS